LNAKRKVGVVLFQLGGPDSLAAVRPFLYNLFSDPDILNLPFGPLLRKPLARFISLTRSGHASHGYAEIGNRSPILPLTQRQALALDAALRPHVEPRVVIAMRYWHPFTHEAVRRLQAATLDEIVLLPLYPQYSQATTGSSLNEWNRRYDGFRTPVRLVREFYAHPLYIDALVERISLTLKRFGPAAPAVHLLFSAHNLPLSFVLRGDPYQKQIEETVRLVTARGAEMAAEGQLAQWPRAHSLCYQSKVGRQKWLEPSLNATLSRLAAEGVRHLAVVPIAFVTEHIETLYEINREARARAGKLGIEQLEMMPALGDSPKFIAALADLVLRAVGEGTESDPWGVAP
jgi:ferrochelatase